METIRFNDVTFSYPLSSAPALAGVSFEVPESEFLVLCGKSGCGKTTLLRQMKKNLMPYGQLEGEILYYGTPVEELDDRRSAAEIGFVQQNPDNQLVTDKVWHELAFGLESLGLDNGAIRRRVAEMASYFDIQGWFRRDVSELSGGQKQLLNLASIMVMQPKLLVLDEPTSQLDPIAASDFLRTVARINRELGVTVILSEHRLEEAFTMADRVMVMDQGSILACDTPRSIGAQLAQQEHPMFHGLPTVTKIYHEAERGKHRDRVGSAETTKYSEPARHVECAGDTDRADSTDPAAGPLTVREGRLWLRQELKRAGVDKEEAGRIWEEIRQKYCDSAQRDTTGSGTAGSFEKSDVPITDAPAANSPNGLGAPAIQVKDVWFRYSKAGPDILRDLNLKIRRGELYCLLGGNGVGKSTTLKAVQGLIKPQRGSIRSSGRMAMLPQNPQALFSEITAEDDLLEALHYVKKSDEEKVRTVEEMLRLLEIEHLRSMHPYDMSGGEQQRLALGKVLLLEPEILLLDEPTKGLDPFFKITLARILHELTTQGITILMVSHDIEFCAQYGDRCAMFFDGCVVSEGGSREFFAGNSFYTTTANRIARDHFPEAITWEEVAACVRKLK